MKKEEIVVYWSPWWLWDSSKAGFDIYYHTPESVYSNILKKFIGSTETKNFIQCPAVMNKLKQTYVMFARTDIDMAIQLDENKKVSGFGFVDPEKVAIGGKLSHSPTLENQFLLELDMSVVFFAEEPLMVSSSSPYFHQTPHLNYGALVPGEFDVGRWFRPINLEYNLWPDVTRLKIDAGEPLVYFSFNTDKKIIFKRFSFNSRLFNLCSQIIRYKDKPKWKSLNFRYQKFKEASMRELVLTEIKNNLVQE